MREGKEKEVKMVTIVPLLYLSFSPLILSASSFCQEEIIPNFPSDQAETQPPQFAAAPKNTSRL